MLVSEFKYDKPKKYDHLSLVCHFTIPLNIRLKHRVSTPPKGLILVTIRRTSPWQGHHRTINQNQFIVDFFTDTFIIK